LHGGYSTPFVPLLQDLDAGAGGTLPAFGVSPTIDIAPGAEGEPLARQLAELVRTNVRREPARLSAFDRLRGSVAIVADDRGTALTLRFDFGRLVIHAGVVGVPDITILGPGVLLEALGDVPRPSLAGLALGIARHGGARAALGELVLRAGPGSLKIYGVTTHPVFVQRLLAVLSRRP
jgi:hypothetical protein